jgi:hypothetical protein
MSFKLVLANEEHLQRDHCCASMTEQVNLHSRHAASPLLGTTDKRIYWSPVFHEYGLICQPSAEILVISHCPFCGNSLPASRRNAWFAELELTGWKTWGDLIPPRFLAHGWQAA